MMATLNKIEDIFREYKSRVYRLALSISRNEKDAEDILQNTFLKITKNLDGFRQEAQISTWIYKIAYNEALMLLRKRKRQFKLSNRIAYHTTKSDLGLFINWSKLPDEQLLESEFKERMDGIIKQMPIKYRMPLLLNNVERLSMREAASVLGLKENSLKTRLHRARLMIKTEIADYFKDRQEKALNPQARRCPAWMRFVYDYGSGSLDGKTKEKFNVHIEDCQPCKKFLGNYLKAIEVTKALQCQDMPEALKEKIETFLQR